MNITTKANHNIINMKQTNDVGNFVFEYIDSKEKLLLPMMYKSLIESNENDKIEKFNDFLDSNYKKAKI